MTPAAHAWLRSPAGHAASLRALAYLHSVDFEPQRNLDRTESDSIESDTPAETHGRSNRFRYMRRRHA